jgi:hypothetical protein
MSSVTALAAELERIDLLIACAEMARRGDLIPESHKARLAAAQERVRRGRTEEPWRSLALSEGLSEMDQDILACVLAPVAAPRVGWLFHELQGGLATAYPTVALIQEINFISSAQTPALIDRVSARAPLVRSGLLEGAVSDPFVPVRPSALARSTLLGWPVVERGAPPGSVEIGSTAGWSDLVLPEHCLRALKEFLYWIRHREQVFDRWGGKPMGGPLALFAGPSGTGKTFSAMVVANALGWPLYRVDLGLLVSKYVGETEKNFNALFDAAHGRPLMLLFDEAESLFGKRGEVREARDRFANMEVSHLLSRIERHDGPCILTSNLREQLDPAFARRFTIVLEFPRPDARARSELWRHYLPPRAPYDEDVEPADIGQGINLTGGQIRNAALHAAFLAAAQDEAIGLRHLARAVWVELGKEGREITSSSLGFLGEHLMSEARNAVH